MELVPLLFAVSYIPLWCLASLGITFIHTLEETDGEIWRVLRVPMWSYFAFQFGVTLLGFVAVAFGQWAVAFVGVRVFDAVVTHGIVKAPGRLTAPLLLIDAAVVCGMQFAMGEPVLARWKPVNTESEIVLVRNGSPRLLGEDWEDHHPESDDSDGFASAQRSPCWPVARAKYIAGRDADGLRHDVCSVCLTKVDLNVHHVVPFAEGLRTGRPELECDPANFITLCREHHLHVGHDPDLDGPIPASWRTSNPNVRRDAARLRKKLHPHRSKT